MSLKALGLIETVGLVALIEASDAMVKAANVVLFTRENVEGGLLTIMCTGELGAVKAAVEAGAQAARRVGEVAAVHVIPRPHEDLQDALTALPPQGTPYRSPSGRRLK
jgi:ethanolamine utilization protein EutM